MNNLQNDLSSLEAENVVLKKKLSVAYRKLQYVEEDSSKDLQILKASHKNELNLFNKNHEMIKVCIYIIKFIKFGYNNIFKIIYTYWSLRHTLTSATNKCIKIS